MQAAIAGRPAVGSSDQVAPVALLARVVERAARMAESEGIAVTLLAPGTLPEIISNEGRISGAFQKMLDARLAAKPAPERVTVGARVVGKGGERAPIVSFSELRSGGHSAPFVDGPVIDETLSQLGATRKGLASARLGRCTVVRLPLGA